MNPMQKKILKLSSEVKDAAQKYYEDGSSPLTDAEFDDRVDELRRLDPNAEVLSVGWGYDINADTTPGEKVAHKYGVVGSLNKCHNWKELGSDFQWRTLAASLKLDGISIALYYKRGKLQRALTRGDGTTGIDITAKALKIAPELNQLRSDSEFTGAIRGEIVMAFADFKAYAERNPEAKNPRNTTAGLINAKEMSDDLNYLSIVVYTVIGDENNSTQFNKVNNMVSWLRAQFISVAPYKTLGELKSTELLDTMESLKDEWYGIYPADGIVLNQLGTVRDGSNISYIAKAFKFKAESKITEVIDVEWSLSKTHYLIPRVHVASVELSGTDVEYCTGFNAQYIRDNNIGSGAKVEITKSGEIIPYILGVVEPGSVTLPVKCPDCGTPLGWKGVHLQCPNVECSNAKRQDLSVWIESLAPVDGLKDAIKFKFIEELYGEDVTIESLMADPPAIANSGLSGHKQLIAQMFTKLFGWDGSSIRLVDAIKACNIPRFGDVTAAKFAEHPEIVQRFLTDDYIARACGDGITGEQLYAIIGVANTEMLYRNTAKLRRLKLIEDRISWRAEKVSSGDAHKVVITGKLSVPRAQFVKELAEHGFVVKDDVNKHTFALITDDPNGTSAKNKAAVKHGIPKLSEAQFREKYM